MNDNSNRTFVASVLFLDIVSYSQQPVSEQLVIKHRFNTLLLGAVQGIATKDRVVLDTGDGAAITFLGNPEDALFTAFAMRDAIINAATEQEEPMFQVRFGINLGPVRQIRDINGQVNMIGDGINIAQRIMSFGDPGVILVSRSYFDVVSCLSADLANLFHFDGTRTDKHVREHSVYSVGSTATIPAPLATASSTATPNATSLIADTPVRDSRVAAETVHQTSGAAAFPKRGRAAIIIFLVAAVLGSGAVLLRPKPAPEPSLTGPASVPPAEEMTGEATVSLAVAPWGEVWLNGKKAGVSPPLKTLTLPPGMHVIEVRNATFPPYTQTVTGGGGKSIQIRHTFGTP